MLSSAKYPSQEIAYRSGINTVKILVVDDHDIIRRGRKQLLTSRPGWEVCGEAKTRREAVALAKQLQPDIVVMDVSMPELDGLESARKINKLFPKMGILILTLHFSDQLVRDIVAAGARAYVLKSDAARDLLVGVEALANQQTFFTPRAADVLLNAFSRKNSQLDLRVLNRSRLTPREREIVKLLAEGKTSREAALALGISVKTAETHRANIMRKLEVHSVSEVVRYAVQNHIIEI